MKRSKIFLLLFMAACTSPPHPTSVDVQSIMDSEGIHLDVYFTRNLKQGARDHDLFVKTAAMLKKAQHSFHQKGKALFIVDIGHALPENLNEDQGAKWFSLLSAIPYDIMALDPETVRLGIPLLKRLNAIQEFPMLQSQLVHKGDRQQSLFERQVRVEKNQVSICVVNISDEMSIEKGILRRHGIRWAPTKFPGDSECTLSLAIAHMGAKKLKTFVDSEPPVDVILAEQIKLNSASFSKSPVLLGARLPAHQIGWLHVVIKDKQNPWFNTSPLTSLLPRAAKLAKKETRSSREKALLDRNLEAITQIKDEIAENSSEANNLFSFHAISLRQ